MSALAQLRRGAGNPPRRARVPGRNPGKADRAMRSVDRLEQAHRLQMRITQFPPKVQSTFFPEVHFLPKSGMLPTNSESSLNMISLPVGDRTAFPPLR